MQSTMIDKDKDLLIDKMLILTEALEKTNNPTAQFYPRVIERINQCETRDKLKIYLDQSIIHAGRITDYGGFNREQCDLFRDMWRVADSICESKD